MGKHLSLAGAGDHARSNRAVAVRHRLHFAPSTKVLSLGVFAAVLGFVMVTSIDPSSGAVASPDYSVNEATRTFAGQSIESEHTKMAISARDDLQTIERLAPAAGIPDPGTAQAIAYVLVAQRGWKGSEFDCLVSLWDKESHWNVYSNNTSSGAYGIPQALPGKKMAAIAPDWQTNPRTQILWGLGYIQNRYGTPCKAWAHSVESNWY